MAHESASDEDQFKPEHQTNKTRRRYAHSSRLPTTLLGRNLQSGETGESDESSSTLPPDPGSFSKRHSTPRSVTPIPRWAALASSLALGLGTFPTAAAKTMPVLRELNNVSSLDPVSLITLFFDAPEKELLDRTGDLTLLSCFGLFVNPTTAWNEYQTLQPGQGLAYYNPQQKIRSSIEVRQVNSYLVALASGRRDCGIVVQLSPLPGKRWWPRAPSWEWVYLRPLILAALVVIAALSRDWFALGAIGALLLGQAVAIARTVHDSRVPDTGGRTEEQCNVFFLASNVTIIVRAPGDLFRQASSHVVAKARQPIVLTSLTTLVFMGGVLLVGFATSNFKVAYLIAHALQAVLIALASDRATRAETINRALWEDGHDPVPLARRRDAYVWATRMAGTGTEWLVDWDLAAGETLRYVERALADSEPSNAKLEDGRPTSATGLREKPSVEEDAKTPPHRMQTV